MAATVVTSAPHSSAEIKSLLAGQIDAESILIRPIDLIAFAPDASFYRLIPKAVVLAKNEEEIAQLFHFSQREGIPMTFRAAGSSLSGQSISDGLLVEVARHWRGAAVENSGKQIRLQPGVIGGRANQLLAPYGAKSGPDPASIATCTIGGILSNNSSGMCCGVDQNAYHTLASMRFMLPSGTVIDTAEPDADEQFHALVPELARGILELKRHIESSPRLSERVRSKYRMKNTTGYSLNAFLDYDRAVDIFQHVLIGSEGTLAFIAEAVLNTVPDLPVKYTRLLLFPDLYAPLIPSFHCVKREPRPSKSWTARRCVPSRPSPEFHRRSALYLMARQACWRNFSPPKKPSAASWKHWQTKRSADSNSSNRPRSRTSPPNRRCCGRFAPACFPRSARCAKPEPRSSSRMLRSPSSARPSANTTTTTPSSSGTPRTATYTSSLPRASTIRLPSISTRASSTTWLMWSSTATTEPSRPSTAPGAIWHPSSRPSGEVKVTKSCGGSKISPIRTIC